MNELILDQLSKHERRHAHAIEDILGIDEEDITLPPKKCLNVDDEEDNFDEQVYKVGVERERDAVKFYTKIAEESEHPRIKEVFYALAEVEYQHSLLAKLHS